LKLLSIVVISWLLGNPCAAQDAKLVVPLQAQRNQVMDAWAQCLVQTDDLAKKVVELQKQLEELKKQSK
jgi:hypothetical protein